MSTLPAITGLVVGVAFVALFSTFSVPAGSSGMGGGLITMERTVCFGTCPAYSLAIYSNGTVMYKGIAFVAITGVQRSEISQENLEQLVQEFYEIDYFSFEDRYEEPVSDLPSTTTSITINGITKSVYRYGSGPEGLEELENRIDQIAGTEKWIKGAGTKPVFFPPGHSHDRSET
ncbi:MAG: DUF6438 domain-containing protein [Nitrososphaera sp.]|nr:DUF6438 domain-containing protein [Nitrososphaera sp.]